MNAQYGSVLTDEQVGVAVNALNVLADPTRLRILWALMYRPHTAEMLADAVDAAPELVARHLATFSDARMIKTQRDGALVYYVAENAHMRVALEEALEHAQHMLKGRRYACWRE